MEEDKNIKVFSPELKVVEAVRSKWANIHWFITSTAVFGLSAYWSLATLLRWFREGGLWLTLTLIFSTLVALITFGLLFDGYKAYGIRRSLRRFGKDTQASIVGKEVDDREESDLYYIYFQFEPGFVVKYNDDSRNQQYYRIPLNDTLRIRYLPDNPEVCGVDFTEK